jgi:hypothetical protein
MSRRGWLGVALVSAAIAGLLLGTAACSESDAPTTYGAQEVESALERHGFEVDVVFDRTRDETPGESVLGLLNLFGEVEGWDALVADSAPDGAIGSTVSAWIFDDMDHADSFAADSALRLQNGNVVVLTDAEHREAASAALDDLR